jgi:hypothetical protein
MFSALLLVSTLVVADNSSSMGSIGPVLSATVQHALARLRFGMTEEEVAKALEDHEIERYGNFQPALGMRVKYYIIYSKDDVWVQFDENGTAIDWFQYHP